MFLLARLHACTHYRSAATTGLPASGTVRWHSSLTHLAGRTGAWRASDNSAMVTLHLAYTAHRKAKRWAAAQLAASGVVARSTQARRLAQLGVGRLGRRAVLLFVPLPSPFCGICYIFPDLCWTRDFISFLSNTSPIFGTARERRRHLSTRTRWRCALRLRAGLRMAHAHAFYLPPPPHTFRAAFWLLLAHRTTTDPADATLAALRYYTTAYRAGGVRYHFPNAPLFNYMQTWLF